jgi:iron complex transport system permease protein
MKVTLDLAKLLEEGRITPEEAARLKGFAAEGTGSAALNILVGFGVAAVALGVIGLVPQPVVAVVLGAILGGVGLGFILKGEKAWAILANICLLTGALMLAAGIMFMTKGSVTAMLTVTAIFIAGGIVARSGLLIALAVLALSAAIGARTGYMRATYFLAIEQPLITVLLFSGLAIAAYQLSKRLKADHARLAITAARTSLLLVNFGFWIGSLWGDRLNWAIEGGTRYSPVIPGFVFSLGWAAAIIGAGIWASRANRPWVLNLAAVFGAIHFYTQWFERLGPNPFSVLVAGVITLGLAVVLWRYNQKQMATA